MEMSLKPRSIDFQETWANLRETVAGVVALRSVERGVWNTRFSDVYALCVAHPEPLADKLYEETRRFLEEHVKGLLERVRGPEPLSGADHTDGLLDRYSTAWTEYSQGVAYLNSLYSYLNLQHIKRQKITEAEIIYGSAATVLNVEMDPGQLEVGELGLSIWERVLIRPLWSALSSRIVSALYAARLSSTAAPTEPLRGVVLSVVQVQAFRARHHQTLYEELVLQPYLERAGLTHRTAAAGLLQGADISHYMREVLHGLECEVSLAARFLPRGAEAVRACYEQATVQAHLPALHAECERLLREAAEDGPHAEERRADLSHMYTLLRPLGAEALRPLVEAAHAQAAREGAALLAAPHARDEAHVHFVRAMLALHAKYEGLFTKVFHAAQPFLGALDKACSQVVNSRAPNETVCRAPELLARYCDSLLRRRAGGGGGGGGGGAGGGGAASGGGDAEVEEKLAAAILVFRYVDDKDVFQKYYARTLARRLIHQLSCSMEQEEGMINRLKAVCGYEFTNKLHRMYTDVAVSADLTGKFHRHVRETDARGAAEATTLHVQVLQAGAWPLGGAMAPLAPPPELERSARMFETFYRDSFSGRRLAWLHHLCTGELRTRYTHRLYHVSATTPQCALLLCFENVTHAPARELRDTLQLPQEAWLRHARPIVESGLLLADGDLSLAGEEGGADVTLSLNLAFHCKRSRVKVTCAAGGAGAGAAGGAGEGAAAGAGGGAGDAAGGGAAVAEVTPCEDDRKMYLQAALVRIMKQRKILRHNELIQEVVSQARGSFAPSVAMIKKCIEALIDKQYLERAPGRLDTYSYLA